MAVMSIWHGGFNFFEENFMAGNKILVIRGAKHRLRRYSGYLEENKFRAIPVSRYSIKYQRTFKPEEKRLLKKIKKKFTLKPGIACEITDEDFARNSSYRQFYFKNEVPYWGNRYRCIYCGRFLKKEDVTIDHIIPIYKAEHCISARMLMKILGLKTVNDYGNLGAACEKCNKKKGSKMGLWAIRGMLGKNKWFWRVRFTTYVIIVAAGLYIMSRVKCGM